MPTFPTIRRLRVRPRRLALAAAIGLAGCSAPQCPTPFFRHPVVEMRERFEDIHHGILLERAHKTTIDDDYQYRAGMVAYPVTDFTTATLANTCDELAATGRDLGAIAHGDATPLRKLRHRRPAFGGDGEACIDLQSFAVDVPMTDQPGHIEAMDLPPATVSPVAPPSMTESVPLGTGIAPIGPAWGSGRPADLPPAASPAAMPPIEAGPAFEPPIESQRATQSASESASPSESPSKPTFEPLPDPPPRRDPAPTSTPLPSPDRFAPPTQPAPDDLPPLDLTPPIDTPNRAERPAGEVRNASPTTSGVSVVDISSVVEIVPPPPPESPATSPIAPASSIEPPSAIAPAVWETAAPSTDEPQPLAPPPEDFMNAVDVTPPAVEEIPSRSRPQPQRPTNNSRWGYAR